MKLNLDSLGAVIAMDLDGGIVEFRNAIVTRENTLCFPPMDVPRHIIADQDWPRVEKHVRAAKKASSRRSAMTLSYKLQARAALERSPDVLCSSDEVAFALSLRESNVRACTPPEAKKVGRSQRSTFRAWKQALNIGEQHEEGTEENSEGGGWASLPIELAETLQDQGTMSLKGREQGKRIYSI